MKMIEINNIYVIYFIHWGLKVLAQQLNKFLRRLEIINTNAETARNDLSTIHDIDHDLSTIIIDNDLSTVHDDFRKK